MESSNLTVPVEDRYFEDYTPGSVGVLGGLRVTLLKDEIGVFHACIAQGFLGLLIVITLATSRLWQRISAEGFPSVASQSLARVAILTTSVIYAQLALGATMRHEHRDLAILDFPTAYGQILPESILNLPPHGCLNVHTSLLPRYRGAARRDDDGRTALIL